MALRVGIDLVSIDDVRRSMQEHGSRYLDRLFTASELHDCGTPDGISAERLAARVAAKEAAMKVLRPGEAGVGWRCIEVRRAPEGWVELELSGMAADLAHQAGVVALALSLTHEAGFASAVVVAEMLADRATVHDLSA